MSTQATRGEAAADTRPPLSRSRILRAAVEAIDRDGLEALSMRRLAADLEVAPMSLYNHVPNKEALLGGITEELLGQIDLSKIQEGDWVQVLKAGFTTLRRVLLQHPNALPVVQRKPVGSPEAFRAIELALATLRSAGFSKEGALNAHWALLGFTLGHVGFQLAQPWNDAGTTEDALRPALPPDEFPHCCEILLDAAHCDFDAAFDFGLDAILQGLQVQLQVTSRE